MTEADIKQLLREKYIVNDSKKEWAYFENFRTVTGFPPNVSYVDAVAVNVFPSNPAIIAYEIKVSRQDFLRDVANFQNKHGNILETCTQFYYICPEGLIRKEEVPDVAGLRVVKDAMWIRTVKVAPVRVVDCIPFPMFQAYARIFGMKFEGERNG